MTTAPASSPQLYTVKEIADVLRTVEGSVYNLVNQRRLPHLHVGRSLKFEPGEVLRWIREGGSQAHGEFKCPVCQKRTQESRDPVAVRGSDGESLPSKDVRRGR